MSFWAPAKLVLVSLGGIGGTVGAVYVGGKMMDFSNVQAEDDSLIETVSDKYKNRLIKSNVDSQKWKDRLKKLRGGTYQNLDPELEKIRKDTGKKESDLKQWCDSVAIQPWEKDSSIVRGVEDFCTLVIKDQVGSGKLISKTSKNGGLEEWKRANQKLKDFKTDKLSDVMKGFQEAIKKDESSDVLEKWCLSSHNKPFMDAKDTKYLDVSGFCVKVPVKPDNRVASSVGNSQPQSTAAAAPSTPSKK